MSIHYKYKMDPNPPNFNRRLMCIEYPGLVKNVDKMLNTLGGLEKIGTTYGTKNRRAEVRFRPDDLYCKPACGDRHPTIALLLKVKIKKQLRDPNVPCSSKDADEPETITFTTSLIGVVDTIYKFNTLCEFQYLPMHPKKGELSSTKLENIYEKLRPTYLPTLNWLNDDNAPLFFIPPVFSRFDTVHYYNAQRIKEPNVNSTVIGRTRKKRMLYGMFLNFSDENVPTKPHTESLKLLQVKFLQNEPYNKIRQLFEERPVWSKNALSYHLNVSKDHMKYLLRTVAYYFLTGPWRVMWVRYGYDPRNIPEARIYQTFDCRLRTIDGMRNKIKAKRNYSNCVLPYKNSPASRPQVTIISRHSIARAYQAAKENQEKEPVDENIYLFRPGMIPVYRQMFYQYCDVLVPEIQTMLANLPLPKPGTKCDSRSGWLPKDFDSRCREIVVNLVTAEVRKQLISHKKKRSQKQTTDVEADDEIVEEIRTEADETPLEEIEISDSENEEDDLMNDSEDDTDTLIDSDMDESLKPE